ncbi:DUF2637 domain-containing protein [Streptomyces sp. NPDC059862]|uniref:DUF2637 domain-containing protein n=1 Tax=Streptomyces sp. NPDC059862 TaxID=3346975 RepID=UPI00365CA996
MAAPLQLTRTHRVLIAVVVFGAVIIAGIGFAGSYAAVRELALKKGFGDFSYVFPIGIDAGICVLLALDLLLTWIRIPFPLLRQSAWLLTAATIAFNAAAAWPDPLGMGMHAVIPILFVVAVEAARHAIGRTADITADKHMEGVRATRWLLSPVPTFLLWRRMKLWELRSYQQAVKLEQERLVYQARLRSRYGRTWRRKAPVEALMPLRLAKYGIPVTDTTPAGPAAAGIEPALIPPRPHHTITAHPATGIPSSAPSGARNSADHAAHSAVQAALGSPPKTGHTDEQDSHRRSRPPREEPSANDNSSRPQQPASTPSHRTPDPPPRTPAPPAARTTRRTNPQAPRPRPSTDQTTIPRLHAGVHARHATTAHTAPPTTGSPRTNPNAPPADTAHTPDARGPGRHETAGPDTAHTAARPTTVDRYYTSWLHFGQQHGREPNANELAAHLAELGIHDRHGKTIKPRTLARYLLSFRIYTTWARHRAHTSHPNPDHIAHDLETAGITGQYNKPLRAAHLQKHHADFERRWHTLTHTQHPAEQPPQETHRG